MGVSFSIHLLQWPPADEMNSLSQASHNAPWGCWPIPLAHLEWPSQSPDLNPKENLWWDLKKAVAARRPTCIDYLKTITQEEWANIPKERCEKLVGGYSSRLQEVIAANGCCTKRHTHLGWIMLQLVSCAYKGSSFRWRINKISIHLRIYALAFKLSLFVHSFLVCKIGGWIILQHAFWAQIAISDDLCSKIWFFSPVFFSN